MGWERRTRTGTTILALAVFLTSTPLTVYAGSTTYTYDDVGRLATATYPNGTVITYSYDLANNRTQKVVAGPDQAPNAVNDSITTAAGVANTFDPRTNDTDPDGDPLTITGKTNGAHGTVTYTSTSVTYTPAAGYSGSDSFTYTISDGRGGTDTATVTVTVTGGTDVTPDTIAWDDIYLDSVCSPCVGENSPQTITGINTSITLVLTFTQPNGPGTMAYVKNGVATTYTSGATVSVSAGDTLYFTVTRSTYGTASGVITVKNQSDANATLDTINYAVISETNCPLC